MTSKSKRKPTKYDSLSFLRRNGLEVSTIIDVGVQRETFELKGVFPDLKHILFEPVEEYFPHIEKNYRAIDYELIRAAVSNLDGVAMLHKIKNNEGAVTHSTIANSETSTSIEVRKVSLDSFFKDKNYDTPYLLKIDVDGHELMILEGARKLLKKVSCLVIEAPLIYGWIQERINFIINEGFVLWDIVDLAYTHGNLWQVDLIFISRNEKNKSVFSRKPHDCIETEWDSYDNLTNRFQQEEQKSAKKEKELEALNTQLPENQTTIQQKDKEISDLLRRYKQLENVISENEKIKSENDKVIAERDALLNSLSWRLTEPARSIVRFIRGR